MSGNGEKKWLISLLIGIVLSLVGTLYAVHTKRDDGQDGDIKELRTRVVDLTVVQGAVDEKFRAIKDSLERLERNTRRQ